MDQSEASNTQPAASKPPGQRPRRPRAARACDLCRSKKYKCDELYPCTYCKSRNVECVYKGQDMTRKRFTPEYVRQLEDKLKNLSTLVDSYERARTQDSVNSPRSVYQDASLSGNINAIPTPNSTSSRPAGEQEVSGVNHHTRDVEYYGSSSTVALLSHVQRTGEELNSDSEGLLTSLHNSAFHSTESQQANERRSDSGQSSHYPQCRGFLENFFSTIHYIHPILEKRPFLERCETLWSGKEAVDGKPSSFSALYYSILSLGAIVGVRDDEPVDGIDNLQWSRRFFDKARRRCTQIGMVTDLEMVQSYFFLAKVCQNELNPHWSYMYVGLAVRTALAMGINREPGHRTKKQPAQIRAESRTWWGLYSLETEMSFAMGRPDTLGADLHHNRQFPLIKDTANVTGNDSGLMDPPHCAIIKSMVDFSRITRSICLSIYLQDLSVPRTVALAFQIEEDLDRWVDSLPEAIRPTSPLGQSTSLRGAKDAQWVKRQRLVLTIRYHNLRILLFGSFLLRSSANERASIPRSQEGVHRCLDSAKETINIIYQTYQHNDFFRTWFYNTTYTVFAASIILVYLTQQAAESEIQTLLQLVDMAIEILEIMDECVVALQSAKLLRRAKEKAEGRAMTEAVTPSQRQFGFDRTVHLNHYWGPLDLLDGDVDFDFAFQLADFDDGGSLLMALQDQTEAHGDSESHVDL